VLGPHLTLSCEFISPGPDLVFMSGQGKGKKTKGRWEKTTSTIITILIHKYFLKNHFLT
jgi:hypothetical protein